MITLPTRHGRIVITEADRGMRCATGCKTMGGGFMLATVYQDGEERPRGVIPICGNCLALAIVDRIDKLRDGGG